MGFKITIIIGQQKAIFLKTKHQAFFNDLYKFGKMFVGKMLGRY